jgi:RNA polymerase sigma-70 factor (ECF subfamily)
MSSVQDKTGGGPRRDHAIDRGIRKYDRLLVAWLTGKFGDADLARDLAQETYLRIWRYSESNDIGNLKALLFKTAANLAANEFRSRARWRVQQNTGAAAIKDGEIEQVACDAPSPERAAVARADARASMKAIQALPERTRRAFVMSRFEGKSYGEIAAELGVSVSSVEKYIIAALTALREAVADTPKPAGNIISFVNQRRMPPRA